MSAFDFLYRNTAGPLLRAQLGRQGCAALVQLVRGDQNAKNTVSGCIVLRDNADVARVSAESGYFSDSEGEREVELAVLEIPVATVIDPDDRWLFDEELWEAVGLAKGRDSAFKTILVRFVSRTSAGPLNSRRR